jgi:hypothetical protein
MDEHKLIRDQDAAARARDVIEAPGFVDAIDLIKSELVARWEGTEDPIVRDELWRAVQLIKRIPVTLRRVIAKGRVSKADLDRLQGHTGHARD